VYSEVVFFSSIFLINISLGYSGTKLCDCISTILIIMLKTLVCEVELTSCVIELNGFYEFVVFLVMSFISEASRII